MARSKFHLTNMQWVNVLMQALYTKDRYVPMERGIKLKEKLDNMTHHEKRLFVRKLMHDRVVAHTVKCIT